MLALVGPSGAGKSTLAKLLLRFYDPHFGRILLDGQDLRGLALGSVRDNIALLLQETLVFDGTIYENIAYGRRGATREQVEAAASRRRRPRLHLASLPDGYETEIGQKGSRLSGGQRQRIAIARAMVRDAPVLILDEPTTGVDAESGSRIMGPLRRLMGGRTTIVISHNLVTVRDADRIAVLEGGRVVGRRDARGAPAPGRDLRAALPAAPRRHRGLRAARDGAGRPSRHELLERLGQRTAARGRCRRVRATRCSRT